MNTEVSNFPNTDAILKKGGGGNLEIHLRSVIFTAKSVQSNTFTMRRK